MLRHYSFTASIPCMVHSQTIVAPISSSIQIELYHVAISTTR